MIEIEVEGYRLNVEEINGILMTKIYGDIICDKDMKNLIEKIKKHIDEIGY